MKERIEKIEMDLFEDLSSFHKERTTRFLEELEKEFGEEALKLVENINVDKTGLDLWHIKRTVDMIDLLVEHLGESVVDIIKQTEKKANLEKGRKAALELGSNTLEDLALIFCEGKTENIVSKNEKEVFIKAEKCLAAKCGGILGRKNILYDLYCNNDQYFVEGFNEKLGCEVKKAIMKGDTYCMHRLFVKCK